MRRLLADERIRYLLVGGWNTFFGYGVSIVLYEWLSDIFHVALIAALANVMAITMSFLTYKVIVFRSRGYWLAEYLRSYLLYGGVALINIALIWLLVDGVSISMWLAQGIAIPLGVVISYLGNSRFTFRRSV